jgi:hypothetical protein
VVAASSNASMTMQDVHNATGNSAGIGGVVSDSHMPFYLSLLLFDDTPCPLLFPPPLHHSTTSSYRLLSTPRADLCL